MKIKKKLSICLILAIAVQALACGTILYPERRGQAKGEIDPGVAILDAVLFIPGILPGVIAFAVDFSTGAIYRSSKKTALLELEKSNDLLAMDLSLQVVDQKRLKKFIKDQTGLSVSLKDCRLYRVKTGKTAVEFFYSNRFKAKNNSNHLSFLPVSG